MAFLSAHVVAPAGGSRGDEPDATVTLDFDARHRRRVRMTTDQGEDFLLNLPEAVALSDGDRLGLDDGRWVRVVAAGEWVVEIRHPDEHGLVRLAWHLGNRHLPVQIDGDVLRIRPDHVIEIMLRGLGAELERTIAPFQPEGGAYSGGGSGHSHGSHSHDTHSHDTHSHERHSHAAHSRDPHSHSHEG